MRTVLSVVFWIWWLFCCLLFFVLVTITFLLTSVFDRFRRLKPVDSGKFDSIEDLRDTIYYKLQKELKHLRV